MLRRLLAGVIALLVPSLAAAQSESGLLAASTHAGVVYFLQAGQVARFDLATGYWYAPLTLAATPTAMAVGDAGLFVAFGRRIARLDAAGVEHHLRNTSTDVTSMVFAGGPLVITLAGGGLFSLDPSDGTILDTAEGSYVEYGAGGLSFAAGRVFAHSVGLSPGDILAVPIGPDGALSPSFDSPYHGDLPPGTRTIPFPGGARVAENSGIVYLASTLRQAGTFGGAITDLAFYGPLPIVLRDDTVIGYDAALREVGRTSLPAPAHALAVHGETVYVFRSMSVGLDATALPVASLGPLDPDAPLDPTGLAYVPDGFAQANDGSLLVLSAGNLSVFRWQLATRGYGPTIPLGDGPVAMAHAADGNRLYLGHASGRITQIRLDASDDELPFVDDGGEPCGLATAGDLVVACVVADGKRVHRTWGPDGALLSEAERPWGWTEYVWSPALRQMFFYWDWSPKDVLRQGIDEAGQIGAAEDSPYHGDHPFRSPLRLAPDGTTLLTGDGDLFDGETLLASGALASPLDEAVWNGDVLLTARRLWPGPDAWDYALPRWAVGEVRAWGTDPFPTLWTRQLPGLPQHLFVAGTTPVAVTSAAGVPLFIPLTCGDGVVDQFEQCDGAQLGGRTCASVGLGGGTLACTPGCRLDASGCFTPPRCGDGLVDREQEVCDGDDLGVSAGLVTCASLGTFGGEVTCDASCLGFGTERCNSCGNGIRESFFDEECDGADLGGETCRTRGRPGGELACTDGCRLDDSACHHDCAASPCDDGDACTVDRCDTVTGCSAEPIPDCAHMDTVLVMRASATITRGSLVGDCAGRCGDRGGFALAVAPDGTYRIPSGTLVCPGEQVAIPDEVGTVRPWRDGRELLEPSNLREVLKATAQCGGFKLKLQRHRGWIRRAAGMVFEGQRLLVTSEKRGRDRFQVRRTTRFARRGEPVGTPRRFDRMQSCEGGLRLRCEVR